MEVTDGQYGDRSLYADYDPAVPHAHDPETCRMCKRPVAPAEPNPPWERGEIRNGVTNPDDDGDDEEEDDSDTATTESEAEIDRAQPIERPNVGAGYYEDGEANVRRPERPCDGVADIIVTGTVRVAPCAHSCSLADPPRRRSCDTRRRGITLTTTGACALGTV
jgi:hypothetical protein